MLFSSNKCNAHEFTSALDNGSNSNELFLAHKNNVHVSFGRALDVKWSRALRAARVDSMHTQTHAHWYHALKACSLYTMPSAVTCILWFSFSFSRFTHRSTWTIHCPVELAQSSGWVWLFNFSLFYWKNTYFLHRSRKNTILCLYLYRAHIVIRSIDELYDSA